MTCLLLNMDHQEKKVNRNAATWCTERLTFYLELAYEPDESCVVDISNFSSDIDLDCYELLRLFNKETEFILYEDEEALEQLAVELIDDNALGNQTRYNMSNSRLNILWFVRISLWPKWLWSRSWYHFGGWLFYYSFSKPHFRCWLLYSRFTMCLIQQTLIVYEIPTFPPI